MAVFHWHAISITIHSEPRSVFNVRGIKDYKGPGAPETADSRRAKEPGGRRPKGRKFKRFDYGRNTVTSKCKGEEKKQMSARHTTWVGVNPGDSFSAENVQLHQEMEKIWMAWSRAWKRRKPSSGKRNPRWRNLRHPSTKSRNPIPALDKRPARESLKLFLRQKGEGHGSDETKAGRKMVPFEVLAEI